MTKLASALPKDNDLNGLNALSRRLVDVVTAGLTPVAAAPLARQLADVDVATLGKFNVSRADA